MSPETRVESDPPTAETTLAAQLAELTSRPAGQTRIGRLRARSLSWVERATTWGPLAPIAEVGWKTFRRDASIGGSVLGAALAYRLFIWLLPLAFILVVGLGIVADTSDQNAGSLVKDAGLTGFIAGSIASSANRTHGWAAVVGLISALVVLLYQTAALLRAARAVTALAWRLPVRPVRRPTRATLLFLCWILLFTATAASAAPLRAALGFPLGLLSTLAVYSAMPVLYLALSWWLLPHAAKGWLELVPGAILFGCALALIGLFNSLFLFPWLAQRQATYGVLGVAAGLLFSFFLFGRTVELAAALNAELAERHGTAFRASAA
jgi:membrane protein